MKRTLKLLMIGMLLAFTTFTYDMEKVEAATGTLSISASSSVTVGNNFTVTIKATGTKIFYWQLYVSYTASKLKLVSGSTTIQGEADDATYGTSTVTRTLTFKPLSTGSATISVAMGDADMNIDTNFNSISYASKSKTISIVPVVPKATNNKLSSLSIDNVTLSPAFNADVTNYTAEIEAGTTEINVNAAAADSKATVAGTGKIAVVEGANNINVDVTAEDGSKKTYTIVANVKEFSPIEVKVDNDTYSVVRKKTLLTAPADYTETTVKIDNEDVPAFVSEITKYTLVGLKDSEGQVALYVYDKDKESYTLYQELTFNNIKFYPMEADIKTLPNGYTKTTISYSDKEITAYKLKASSKYALLYGMNVTTGKKDYYMFDSSENTLQKYNSEGTDALNKQLDTYLIIMLVLIATNVVFLVLGIIFLIKYLKAKKGDSKIDKLIKMAGNKKRDTE